MLTGAFVQTRSGETVKTATTRFERQVGRRQSILHFYHVGTKLFPTPAEISLATGGRRLFLSWKPESGHTWAQVAAGAVDDAIDREANYVKSHYKAKFFLAIHHEPEDEVKPVSGSGYTAKDYAHMYQRVVKRFRAKGVTNAVFVMVYMGAQKHVTTFWFKNLWPGASYVDWIAYDPYVTPKTNGQSGSFPWMVNVHWGSEFTGMYNWIRANHPRKPIMLAEWGVAEKPGDATYKGDLFRSVPRLIGRYPKIKAMVYFDSPIARSGKVQADTTARALNGYKAMSNSSCFFG
ncbi:glycosyl hydrolase [Microlunatus sp. Gsoil 973]|uniref:glycosyl hydrolase n=1 Tax=Microlunatus sp. Gsoil 973 TaxID=2672569 RepID=UPI0012B443D0|nr:glycosyl hydrolase [Microlunatus sp. Gsoil 973]QGN33892.1 hypothetical protein GJV80_14930 [Microlunatus sp. Gsoil 973]